MTTCEIKNCNRTAFKYINYKDLCYIHYLMELTDENIREFSRQRRLRGGDMN